MKNYKNNKTKKIKEDLKKLDLKTSKKINNFIKNNKKELKNITKKDFNSYFKNKSRNKSDYPEEYIDGIVEFFYKIFYIDKESLIPRLETEDLVRYAIELVKSKKYDYLIDIGTGVGIIPISIKINSGCSNIEIFGLELISSVLKTSEKNNKKHNTNISFKESNLLDIFLKKDSNKKCKDTNLKTNSKVLITANLPYIAENDEIGKDVLRYEPRTALFGGGKKGFKLYKKLFNQIIEFAEKYKVKELDFVFEIGDHQQDVARRFLNKKRGLFNFCFKKDLIGIDRFIYGSLNIEFLKNNLKNK